MSLRAFHILFIVSAVTLAAGFGLWALRHDAAWGLSIGLVSLTLAVALAVYLAWFIRKIKGVSS
ncbi:MAG: hypothetical protein HYT89_02780 [Candidatus Omnitrophica bacterium]|nr:hypothetical protein [Candidatus Omnitrophota bacterium]